MEKVLSAMQGDQKLRARRVLELNGSHPVFQKLRELHQAGETEKVKAYAQLLYAQAQLLEGIPVEDPAAFSAALDQILA